MNFSSRLSCTCSLWGGERGRHYSVGLLLLVGRYRNILESCSVGIIQTVSVTTPGVSLNRLRSGWVVNPALNSPWSSQFLFLGRGEKHINPSVSVASVVEKRNPFLALWPVAVFLQYTCLSWLVWDLLTAFKFCYVVLVSSSAVSKKNDVDVNRSVWRGPMANGCLRAAVKGCLWRGTSSGRGAIPPAQLLLVGHLVLLSSAATACFGRTGGESPRLSGSCCKTRFGGVGVVVFSIFRSVFWGEKIMCQVTKKM